MIRIQLRWVLLVLALVFAWGCDIDGDGSECDPEEVDSPCDTVGDTETGALIESTFGQDVDGEVDGGI